MKDVNSSTTTLTFTAPSLPDGVFSGTVVVMVTAVNRFGVGPASDPAIAVISGTYVLCYIYMYTNTYTHQHMYSRDETNFRIIIFI